MTDERQIKTYVWHKEKCFFVSTIERDCSALHAPHLRYNETIVWAFDWEKQERGELLLTDGAMKGSIRVHQKICERIYEIGMPEEPEEQPLSQFNRERCE